jgi:pyruvate kinase
MKRLRNVKILATLGPASSDEAMIQKLHEAGADLFRINMSHSSHELMRTLVGRIRAVEKTADVRSASWQTFRGRNCGSASLPKAR